MAAVDHDLHVFCERTWNGEDIRRIISLVGMVRRTIVVMFEEHVWVFGVLY